MASPGGVAVEPAAGARAAASTVEADVPPPAAAASPWQVEAMLAAADYWLQPLGPSGPNYEEVALAGYRIAMVPEAGPGAIAIQRGQQPLVQRAADGEWRSRATVDDWQRFEALLGRGFGDVPAVAVRLDKASDRRLLWTPEAGCTSTLPRSTCRTLQRTVATVLQNAARIAAPPADRRADGLVL